MKLRRSLGQYPVPVQARCRTRGWRKSFSHSSYDGADSWIRSFVVGWGVLLTLMASPSEARTGAEAWEIVRRFDIPALSADQALARFAEQAGITFVFPADKVALIRANAIKGELTPRLAVKRLLKGTRLRPRILEGGGLSIEITNEDQRGEDKMKSAGIMGAVGSLLLGILPGVGEVAFAQDGSVRELEEVVVVARKRVESLQDTPLAVSAFDEAFIESTYAQELQDFDKYAPNVELGRMQFGPSAMTASIRGVSFADLERSYEPAVGVSVDGVFLANNTGAMVDTIDLASIEILRGPQGTLFGRNTIGGTINITRTRPTGEWGGKVAISHGSYGRTNLKGLLNVPLVQDVAALKVAAYSLKSDSHTRNVFDGKRDGGIDKQSYTVSLLLTPSENFEALISFDHLDDDSEYPGVVNLTENELAAGRGLLCWLLLQCASSSYDVSLGNGFSTSYGPKPFLAVMESDLLTAQLRWDLGSWSIKSITGIYDGDDTLDAEVTGANDIFGLGIPAVYFVRAQQFEQFSQEINLSSDLEGAFNFVAGAYFMDSSYDMASVAAFGGPVCCVSETGQDLEAWALFAEMTYDLSENTRVIVGGRYTNEEKDFYRRALSPADGSIIWQCPDPAAEGGCRTGSDSWSEFTPRVILDHHFSDDVMTYLSYSTGFRSGGWDGRAAAPANVGPYEPETVDSLEAGLRSQIFGNTVRFNVSAFLTKYKDKQEEVITPAGLSTNTQVSNASKATISGLEVELDAIVTDNLRVRAALGLLDAKYDQFREKNPATGQLEDVRAQRNFRYAPEYSASLGVDYTWPMASGALTLGAVYKATDEFTTSPKVDPLGLDRDIIDAYETLDLSLTYRHNLASGNTLTLSLSGDDVTHADGRLFRTLDAGNYWFGDQEPGRTWLVQMQYDF